MLGTATAQQRWAAVTSTLPPQPYPFVAFVEAGESGLPHRSVVNCAQVATIQQTGPGCRLRPPRGEDVLRPIGKLSPSVMAEIDRALKYSLGLM